MEQSKEVGKIQHTVSEEEVRGAPQSLRGVKDWKDARN